jgi:hypothetical protein
MPQRASVGVTLAAALRGQWRVVHTQGSVFFATVITPVTSDP